MEKEQNVKTQEVMNILKSGIEELVTSEKWIGYLKFKARFRRYSFKNTLLIMIQRPDATYIKGLKQWNKEFNRFVKKGEKGIAIFAPLIKKIKAYKQDEDGNEVEYFIDQLVGYKVVYVYDVNQTNGEPLPESPYQRVRGDNAQWLLDSLVKVGQSLGFSINFEQITDADGYVQFSNKKIVIDPRHEINHQVSVLAHELGHALLHEGADMTAGDKEFEAESVSFAVLYQFGIDSKNCSFPYIAGWKNGDLEECIKKFESQCERIQSAANKIIEMVENQISQKSEAA